MVVSMGFVKISLECPLREELTLTDISLETRKNLRLASSTLSMERMLWPDRHIQVGRDSVEPPAHEMGRNPPSCNIRRSTSFPIYGLSARTARQSLAPALRRFSSFRHIIRDNSVPFVSRKNLRLMFNKLRNWLYKIFSRTQGFFWGG
jgi:hypothetical protein